MSLVIPAVGLLVAAVAVSVAAAPIWRRRTGRRPGGGDRVNGQRGKSGPGAPVLTPGPDASPGGPQPLATAIPHDSPRRSLPGSRTCAARLRTAATGAWRGHAAARWGPAATALVCGGAGLGAGPIAAGVLAAYGATGFVLVRGLAVRQSERRAYRLAADAVVGLAADLRAGSALAPAWQCAQDTLRRASAGILPGWRSARRVDGRGSRAVVSATGDAAGSVAGPAAATWDVTADAAAQGPPDRRPDGVTVVVRRVVAAMALAQACGAPLADVLDRLDAHLRAVERTRSVASSQAAGARVSAGLLAAMPVAGVGLGAVVGVDAWEVLLRTPAGALALGLAVALQLGGLAWAARLAAPEASL